MSFPANPDRDADQCYQCIAGRGCRSLRAWLVLPAAIVRFPCSDAGQADARSFCAPDRPITVPHRNRRTGKNLPCGNNRCGSKEEQETHSGKPSGLTDPSIRGRHFGREACVLEQTSGSDLEIEPNSNKPVYPASMHNSEYCGLVRPDRCAD